MFSCFKVHKLRSKTTEPTRKMWDHRWTIFLSEDMERLVLPHRSPLRQNVTPVFNDADSWFPWRWVNMLKLLPYLERENSCSTRVRSDVGLKLTQSGTKCEEKPAGVRGRLDLAGFQGAYF